MTGSGVDPPSSIVGFNFSVGVFWFELGGHWGREDARLEMFGRDDSDNLDGEMMADMNDSARQDVILGSKRFFQSVDLCAKLRDGGRGKRLGVGLHGVHVEERLFKRLCYWVYMEVVRGAVDLIMGEAGRNVRGNKAIWGGEMLFPS